jgi:hypothetical protein
MKKILVLFALIAIAGLASINVHAHHNDFYGFGGFSPFGYGYGFGGYGMAPAFTVAPGFGYGMTFAGFNGFDYGFTAHTAVPNSIRKIVPIPATASANTSISYDADGNIHVRPFDDEDLFVED